jgi:hypothetical protein
MILLLVVLLLAAILMSSYRLTIDICKKGAVIQGGCKLAWFGLTLWRTEVPPQSAGEFLQSIAKDGKGETEFSPKAKSDEDLRETSKKKDARRSMSLKYPVNAAYSLADITIRLLRSLLLKKFSCCLCFGLDDPADTAIFSGYLYTIAGVLGLSSERISIVPWFHGERLEGDFMAEVEMRPLLTLWAAVQSLRLRQTRLLLKGILGWG